MRTYVIGPDGLVNYPEDKATGRLVRSHDGIHLRLSNGQMELLRHLGNEIGIDHFSYARDYPKKVSHKATATKIP